MVFLIDEKRSRQNDYGWNEKRFAEFKNLIVINSIAALSACQPDIFSSNNIILFHESFYNSVDSRQQEIINSFKTELKKHEGIISIAYFSGSKNTRWIDPNGKVCMLSPDVLYCNLLIFLNHWNSGEFDFRYLLFGENIALEENLRNRMDVMSSKNINMWVNHKIPCNKNVFYASTENYIFDCPFDKVDENDNWDFFGKDVTDNNLDELVKRWFAETVYDAIFIPICFGQTLSDFMGLRLAMHIRLTKTACQFKPIYLYGEVSIDDLCGNSCFDILKSSSVHLLRCDYDLMKNALDNDNSFTEEQFSKELERIHLEIPTNIGDNHSVANQWALFRWKEMLNWYGKEPEIMYTDFDSILFYKYLVARFGRHDRFNKIEKKYSSKISGISNKTIVYIDDEYDKGWSNIFKCIFENSNAHFLSYDDFNKKYSKKELIDKIKIFLNVHNADCYLIDLRLHEDDFSEDKNLSGHEIAEYIKQRNKGNQIVIFSASNKIWNLNKELFELKATGYALKESPDLNYTRDESKQLFIDFSNSIKRACNLSYLKDLFEIHNQLKKANNEASDLDTMLELLVLDNGNNNPSILNSILMIEIAFMEKYIQVNDKLSLLETGKDASTSVELCLNGKNIQKLTGHLFFKRVEFTKGHTNIVDALYSPESIEEPSLWSNVGKSDATLTIASLLLYYGLAPEDVKLYINLKIIRNTQVAHKGEIIKNLAPDYQKMLSITNDELVKKLVQSYYNVIVPVVLKNTGLKLLWDNSKHQHLICKT